MVKSYGKLLLVAVVGVILILDGVVPLDFPAYGESPTGIYGYGDNYTVNLRNFRRPVRMRSMGGTPAVSIFTKGISQMRSQHMITNEVSASNIANAVVDKYEQLNGDNTVYKIRYYMRVGYTVKYKCVTFGYSHKESVDVTMVDAECKPV